MIFLYIYILRGIRELNLTEVVLLPFFPQIRQMMAADLHVTRFHNRLLFQDFKYQHCTIVSLRSFGTSQTSYFKKYLQNHSFCIFISSYHLHLKLFIFLNKINSQYICQDCRLLTCAIKVTLEIFGTVFIQSILESDHKSYHIILNSENYIFVDPEKKEKYISPTRLLLFIENDDLLFQLLYSLTIKD